MGKQFQIPAHIGDDDDQMWEWVTETVENILSGIIVSGRKDFDDEPFVTNVEIYTKRSRIYVSMKFCGCGIGYSWAIIKDSDGKPNVDDFMLEHTTLEGGAADESIERSIANV